MNRASTQPVTLIIMAAGMGHRFGGLKQIEPVGPGGELLMEYSIFDAFRVGVPQVVLVIRAQQEETFREILPRPLLDSGRLTFVHQELDDVPNSLPLPITREKPWGTGHAVYSARSSIRGPFAVINADDFYGASSYAALHAFLTGRDGRGAGYGLVGFPLACTLSPHGPVSRGLCSVDADGCLSEIVEHAGIRETADGVCSLGPDGQVAWHSATTIASMNMWALPASFLQELERQFARFLTQRPDDLQQEEFYLPSAVDEARRTRGACVHVLPTSEAWMGVTFREDLSRVQTAIRDKVDRGVYPNTLWERMR